MMTKFKDYLTLNRGSIIGPSVKLTLSGSDHTLFLRFDTKDVLKEATYLGKEDVWLGSLCSVIVGKTATELKRISLDTWDESFGEDQFFLDLKFEISDLFFFKPLEMLKASLAIYLGEEFVYKSSSPIICRCFGVREADIKTYLHEAEEPSVEDLARKTKATLGCRSCLSQISKWFLRDVKDKKDHFYKDKPKADWIVSIDYMLNCFPEAEIWGMELAQFKNNQVIISFDKESSQKEIEEMNVKLQDFLAASVDSDLSFLLFNKRHLSKA